jgi:SAM-dependent methyltransferase
MEENRRTEGEANREGEGAGEGNRSAGEDRFATLASNYDRWVGWDARLAKEMPFLMDCLSLAASGVRQRPGEPAAPRALDVGCGTGAHAIAIARAGWSVTGLDLSAAMLEQARTAENAARERHPGGGPAPASAVEWTEGDIRDESVLADQRFTAVLALGNALLSVGDEAAVHQALRSMISRVEAGGLLLLQYLNGTRIRREDRMVVKTSGPEVWLRHHFTAGEGIYFHSYILRQGESGWTAEVQKHELVDLPPEKIAALLHPSFAWIEIFDGLSGNPFEPERSDAIGVRALGRR